MVPSPPSSERVKPRDVKTALVLLNYLFLEHRTVENSLLVDSSMLLIKESSEGKPKTSSFDRVMRSTNVSLNAIVAPQVKGHVLNTHGRFGCEDKKEWPCRIGMNEKGSMNDEEFERYVNNSIVPLIPDLEDTPGKCILLKVDSSSGHNGQDLDGQGQSQI